MPTVYVSLGSNIDREHNIRTAVEALRFHFGPLIVSSVYETQAQGFDGDPFYNLVVAFETALSVDDTNTILRRIENQQGRQRGEQKFAPRTLDLDLLLYGDAVMESRNIPRDEITRYAFVLKPLAEIAPDVEHPCQNQAMRELWREFQRAHDVNSKSIYPIPFIWNS